MPPESQRMSEDNENDRISSAPRTPVGESVLPPGAERFTFPELSGTAAPTETPTLDVLDDMELDLRIDLGQAYMRLDDVLRLEPGAVVSLDNAAEEPVDVVVGGQVIARGELLVLDGRYCVRVTSVAGR